MALTPDEFAVIDRERPEIYDLFSQVVAMEIRLGRTKPIGPVWALYEARYRYGLRGVTNDVAPYLARKWLRLHPNLPVMFDLKPSIADTAPGTSAQFAMAFA